MTSLTDGLAYVPQLLGGLRVSLLLTGVSLALGLPLGLLLAIAVGARHRAARGAALVVVEVGRGAPVLVILQLVYFGLPTTGLVLSSFLRHGGAHLEHRGLHQRGVPRRSQRRAGR